VRHQANRHLSTTSTTNGIYTPPKHAGDVGHYKEETQTVTRDTPKPTLSELKETLAHEESNLDALLGVFDMQKDQHRFINLETLSQIRHGGQVYEVAR